VLVFEDLQWADSGLLDFIDHLLDWSKALPIMVVTLARPELFDRRPDWAAGRRHLTALALEPLTDDAITELLAGLVPGLPEAAVRAIVARAEGVPLYAVETVRSLLADGRIERIGDAYQPTGDLSQLAAPESLRSLIASRLDGLEPGDRSLLQEGAVLGQAFSADALAAVSGVASPELEPRLRAFVRRELLELETDPQSPERGQYKFVQSLIREVAYGTLGRRERRARHLAVARYYEALGDDELAGALASHYLAAHEASDPGPEADAIATQARLALVGAAERAAGLGAHRQTIAHLEQALAITTATADRAPLLDRAAVAAAATAIEEAESYAQRAVEAYRELGDETAAALARARLGRVLLDASRVTDATAVLEAAASAADALDDPSAGAAIQAQLSRCYMRLGKPDPSMTAADRALSVGERMNLEPLVAESLINKGSALGQLGRRREGNALMRAAVEISAEHADRNMEIRARNNYASAINDDDPAGATRLMRSAMELAADIGDRGMYHWLAGNVAASLRSEGQGWDGHLALMRDAYESATLPTDRARLRVLIALLEAARGENLDDADAAVGEIVGTSTEPEAIFQLAMVRAETSFARGDPEGAYRQAMRAYALELQDQAIPLDVAFHAAAALRDPERIREVARLIRALPGAGRLTEAGRSAADAAVAAVDGRVGDALTGFRAAFTEQTALEQHYDAARVVVAAATLLADQPEIRALASEVRPLLEELRARPALDRLEAALGGAPDPTESSAGRAGATASAPARSPG
jgi:tetratricopeptide (TPR) repeat protein